MNSKQPLLLDITIIMLFLVLLYFSSSIQPSLSQTNLNQKYTNAKCGITIMYPSNWIKEELNEKFGEGTSAPMTGLANFEPDTAEGYKSLIETEAWDISQHSDRSIEGIAEFEKEYIQLSPEAAIVEAESTGLLANKPTYKIVYTQPIPDSQEIWKIMETYIVSGDMQYTIRFTATDNESYDKYISVVDNIIKSVIIDENKKC